MCISTQLCACCFTSSEPSRQQEGHLYLSPLQQNSSSCYCYSRVVYLSAFSPLDYLCVVLKEKQSNLYDFEDDTELK